MPKSLQRMQYYERWCNILCPTQNFAESTAYEPEQRSEVGLSSHEAADRQRFEARPVDGARQVPIHK